TAFVKGCLATMFSKRLLTMVKVVVLDVLLQVRIYRISRVRWIMHLSVMYGFLALESDAVTVAGLGFYEHAETPGLGGEVDNPNWKAQWRGKKFLTDQGDPAIRMYKGSVTASTPEGEYKFDALSGATLTSRGVENLMRFWAGDLGYGPYLKRVQEKGV
ncbi:MAG: FMN-binding protein, partial [Gammaproteobacteria bacterium]